MTEVYRIVEIDGKDECYLFCGEAPYQPGLYVASVLHWKRRADASEMAAQHFSSTKSLADAKKKAEDWVKKTLFQTYRETLLREA